jgi:putative transcriptional regulator, araC family
LNEETKAPEYRKSGLKAEEAPELHQQLLRLMQTEKPYLEPKLSLTQLAERLGVLPNHLSQIINQYEEKNFYDFVNSYRVEEFIALAKKDTDKNFNLLGLAFEAGFNSKSSFNQVFKKFKGQTPSEFLS